MAIRLTPFEIDRWNSDDQAIATLGDAHWDHFFTERRYGKYGVESRKHKAWRKGLYVPRLIYKSTAGPRIFRLYSHPHIDGTITIGVAR